MELDVINQIIKSYKEKKKYMNPGIVGEDIVSFKIKQQTSDEFITLQTETKNKLLSLYNEKILKIKVIGREISVLEDKLKKATGFEEPILKDRLDKLNQREESLIEQKDLIKSFLKNEFNMSMDELNKIDSKPSSEEDLTDVSEELRKNSKVLEDSARAIEELANNVNSINVNEGNYLGDSNNENQVRVRPKAVPLVVGRYVSRTEFKQALSEYYGATKDKKMKVEGVKDSVLDPEALKQLQNLFIDCHSIFIDLENNAFSNHNGIVENIGEVSGTINPGSYIPLSEAMDDVTGGVGTSLVKTKH